MGSDLKLHDKLTGLKLSTIRVKGAVRATIQYLFDAPCPIPPDMLPDDSRDTRANIAAFNRINQYLKDRIVLLD